MILVGISHSHTKYSYDGKLSLREFKQFLVERNIDFALITEHTDFLEAQEGEKFIKECHNLSDEKITLIPGFEVPYRDAHILMIDVDHFVKTGECNGAELEKWRKHAQIAVWAHPHRNRYLLYDAIKKVIDGIEVWNSQYDGKHAPRMKVLNSLQGLRERGGNVFAYAGIDFHREEHFEGPNIVVDAENRPEDIIAKLKTGEFVLKNERVSINGEGRITKGVLPLMRVQSAFSISVITLSKKISALAAKLHIPIPKRLKHSIRTKI